jgi:hypothetical protein
MKLFIKKGKEKVCTFFIIARNYVLKILIIPEHGTLTEREGSVW